MACMESSLWEAIWRVSFGFLFTYVSFEFLELVFLKLYQNFGTYVCTLNVLNNQTMYFIKRHFRSFNITNDVILWQSRPRYSIPLQIMNLGVWHYRSVGGCQKYHPVGWSSIRSDGTFCDRFSHSSNRDF